MKIKNIWQLLLLMSVFVFQACNDDTDPKVPVPSTSIVMGVPTIDIIVLKEETANSEVLTVTWEADDATDSSYITGYGLQIDTLGNEFRTGVLVGASKERTYTAISKDLNRTIVNNYLNEPEVLGSYEIRIVRVAYDKDNNPRVISGTGSNSYTLDVTPFKLSEPLYIPGAHNGWTFAQNILFNLDEKRHEGYAYLTTGGFKLSEGTDWDAPNYGDGGKDSLKLEGENLKLLNNIYWVTVDMKNLKWTNKVVQWAIIGDATGGWDVDIPMVYDEAKQLLTVTVDLVEGKLKFRRDSSRDVNLGGDLDALSLEGLDISVTTAGKYIITLDLISNPAKYTATMNLVEE